MLRALDVVVLLIKKFIFPVGLAVATGGRAPDLRKPIFVSRLLALVGLFAFLSLIGILQLANAQRRHPDPDALPHKTTVLVLVAFRAAEFLCGIVAALGYVIANRGREASITTMLAGITIWTLEAWCALSLLRWGKVEVLSSSKSDNDNNNNSNANANVKIQNETKDATALEDSITPVDDDGAESESALRSVVSSISKSDADSEVS